MDPVAQPTAHVTTASVQNASSTDPAENDSLAQTLPHVPVPHPANVVENLVESTLWSGDAPSQEVDLSLRRAANYPRSTDLPITPQQHIANFVTHLLSRDLPHFPLPPSNG